MEVLRPKWLYILLALAPNELHGAAIQREVRRLTEGRVELWPVSLYGALEELEERGLIHEVESTGRRRNYSLTIAGRGALKTEADRLGALAERVRSGLAGVES